MAQFELLMPKLGESIEEATITKWFVKVGDIVEDDDILLEIATDKVDSEIPSPVSGKIIKILYKQDESVPVQTVIALIDTDIDKAIPDSGEVSGSHITEEAAKEEIIKVTDESPVTGQETVQADDSVRYYSPLVRKIANQEGLTMTELASLEGTGLNGRVRKQDILGYLESRKESAPEIRTEKVPVSEPAVGAPATIAAPPKPRISVSVSAGDEIIVMDRMRKLIAQHMVMSKQVSAHVTNMLEADVTEIVLWRNRIKDEFLQREKEKITFLPVFLEATIKTLKDFPMINASVDADRIILRKRINLGIAVALPTGNLIVPVIKDADQFNLLGLTKALNRIADNARNNKLGPDDIQGGTFTVSNFGTFRNSMGTPIINQPQVAVLAIGAIEKKPAVIETSTGDIIGIRHKMFLSLTYDHRIIDGAYGGSFLRKLADYLESFDSTRTI